MGWGAGFKDFHDFHERSVPYAVSSGSPEVTAKVTVLEDLTSVPDGFFDAEAKGSDPQPLTTILLDETALRKNLMPAESMAWPPLQNGPLEGNVTTEVVADREGRVREIGSMVSENSAINDAGRQHILAMRFTPFIVNGVPVQAMSQITVPFRTVRPAGTEPFESARTYFERGRRVSFPAGGAGSPYILRAEFETGIKAEIAKGRYQDTWLSDTRWRRDAWLENSHYARSRDGDQFFQESDGPQAGVLQLLFRIMEPIPATDTFQEADWRIKRDNVNGISSLRVLTGYESPEGKLDPEQGRGYWFDDNGLLLKTIFNGVESQRSDFQNFAGVKVAHRVDVLKDGRLAMRVSVTDIAAPGTLAADTFKLKDESRPRFTSEVR